MERNRSLKQISFSRPYLFKEEARAAADTVLSGWIAGGPRLAELESLFAAETGKRHAVGVSSWTTGAFLVLKAWGIGPGDEVIVPSYSFIATANVVVHAGAKPVFCDINPDTHNMDVAHAASLVTGRTRAILPVDQLGMPCDMDAVRRLAAKKKLHVLEDAACAIGSVYKKKPVGSQAEAAVFSLHARKIVTCGEGGMIVTDDEKLAVKLKLLRHQGMSVTDIERHQAPKPIIESYPEIGYNMRMTDIQAAVACIQMKRLGKILRLRRKVTEGYAKRLGRFRRLLLPREPDGTRGNWQSYMISLTPDAGITVYELMCALHARGIPTRRGVMAAHLEPCYKKRGVAVIPSLPHTEYAVRHNLLLPVHPQLTQPQLDRVSSALWQILG